ASSAPQATPAAKSCETASPRNPACARQSSIQHGIASSLPVPLLAVRVQDQTAMNSNSVSHPANSPDVKARAGGAGPRKYEHSRPPVPPVRRERSKTKSDRQIADRFSDTATGIQALLRLLIRLVRILLSMIILVRRL